MISLLSNFTWVKPGQQTHASGCWYGKLYSQRLKKGRGEVHNALDRSPLQTGSLVQSSTKPRAKCSRVHSLKSTAIEYKDWSPLRVRSLKLTTIESKARNPEPNALAIKSEAQSSLKSSPKPEAQNRVHTLRPEAHGNRARNRKLGVIEPEPWEWDLHYRATVVDNSKKKWILVIFNLRY